MSISLFGSLAARAVVSNAATTADNVPYGIELPSKRAVIHVAGDISGPRHCRELLTVKVVLRALYSDPRE